MGHYARVCCITLAAALTVLSHAMSARAADAQPLSVGIAVFNALYSQKPTLIQTAAIMSIFVPVAIFFFAQRAFMRGIVITGVEK